MSDPAWSFSQGFAAEFQASRTELESRVELAKSTKITADALQTLYDQRQYELQLKGLQKSLEELRTLIPKSKFAFKRKAPAPSAQASPSLDPPVVTEISQPDSAPVSTNLTLSSHSLRYLTMAFISGTSQASDLTISDLNKCVVNLLGEDNNLKISALHIRNLTDTVLLLPIIQGSVLLHDLRRCVVVVGCHQFRMHTSTNVDVYLSIPSTPIIEHCSQIRFSSYPAALRISEDTSRLAQCPLHPRFLSHQIHTLTQLVDATSGRSHCEVASREYVGEGGRQFAGCIAAVQLRPTDSW
ncbi:C-CAP/cofactor C-like domain-containing protein [Mycena venus]|uniref:C-CAP/cofactor C-like domain-containing protein n=1 Tax=Mycena venus TaxID=2733690 RepID=A0A8H6XLG0_9AGAR|nr:C-CAP/cofactor C-like domain-containing protein [Mycena venus]